MEFLYARTYIKKDGRPIVEIMFDAPHVQKTAPQKTFKVFFTRYDTHNIEYDSPDARIDFTPYFVDKFAYNENRTGVTLELKEFSEFIRIVAYTKDEEGDIVEEDEGIFQFYELSAKEGNDKERSYDLGFDLAQWEDGTATALIYNPQWTEGIETEQRISYCVNSGNTNEAGDVVLREVAVGVGTPKQWKSWGRERGFNTLPIHFPLIVLFEPLGPGKYYATLEIYGERFIREVSFDGARFINNTPQKMVGIREDLDL